MMDDGVGSLWNPVRLWSAMIASVLFLSRLPLGAWASSEQMDFRQTSHAFPLAGIVVALPGALVLIIASLISIPNFVAALLAVSATILVTGALHEDGLADVADGFWGGSTRERKLAIMRDSAIGTYGTLALVLSVALRVAMISQVAAQLGAIAAVFLFIALASCSRQAMLWPWTQLDPARPDEDAAKPENNESKNSSGLSIRFGAPDMNNYWTALVLCIPAFAIILFIAGPMALIAAAVFGQLGAMIVTTLAKNHIGGHTGDVLGATQQISELGLYLGLLVAI